VTARGEAADRVWPWLAAGLLYTVLACIYCWPVLVRFSTHLPNDIGDPGLNAWILWWNTQAIPFTDRWWNAPIFFPTAGAFAYSETLLGLTVLTTPLIWMGASAVEAYNAAFIASFVLCAGAAHALAYRLTGRHDGALIAGLAFGFHPYRAAQITHLQMLWAMWMPLGLLALHQYLQRRRARDLLFFAVCWAFNALSCGYYLVFYAVLVACWMLWFVRERTDWLKIVTTTAAASLPVVPLLLGYTRILGAVGASRGRNEIESMSADLSSFWAAAPNLGLARFWTLSPGPENELYVGGVIFALVVGAGAAAWSAAGRWVPSVRPVWFGCGVVALIAAFLIWVTGGVQTVAFGLPVSVTRPHRLVGVGLWLVLIALTGDARFTDGWRRRSVFLFYVVAALVMLAFALGPVARVFGERFMDRAPYYWLMQLPGGDSLRVPARFAMLVALCLAQAAALAWTRLTPHGTARALVAGLAALIVADGWVPGLRAAGTPPPFNIPDDEPAAVVLEVPTRDTYDDSAAMIRATHHGRTLINGFSGYFPGYYGALQEGVIAADETVIETVRGWGPVIVVVDTSRDPDGEYGRMMDRVQGAKLLRLTRVGPAYLVPARPRVALPGPGESVAIAAIETSANPKDAARLVDGRLDTRWESDRPQEPGEDIRIRLAQRTLVSRIEIDLGGVERCYPRRLRVRAFTEQEGRDTVFDGKLGGRAVAAALADPRRGPLTIELDEPVAAESIVLTQLGRDAEDPFGAAEIRIIGTTAP
jgi:hypothetical protein